MKKIKIVTGILALVAILSVGNSNIATAGLIEKDLFNVGDALLTVDTSTGLEWLDVTETTNLSYNDVINGVGNDWVETHGFRYASRKELHHFFTEAGTPDKCCYELSLEARQPASLLLRLWGEQRDYKYLYNHAITGLGYEDLQGSGETKHVVSDVLINISTGAARVYYGNEGSGRDLFDSQRSLRIGSALVRAQPPVILPNQMPLANAGTDFSIATGDSVTLDGSASSDPDEDYPLDYSWTLITQPGGSITTLQDANAANASFTADMPGDYVVELVVTDSQGAISASDRVIVTSLEFYTQSELDEAVSRAEEAKDLIIADLTSTITTLNTTVETQNSTITSLMATVTERDETIVELNATIAEQEATIASLNQLIEANIQTISDLNNTIASMYTQEELDQAVAEATPVNFMSPIGSIHAYDNMIGVQNNQEVEVTLGGYVLDEISIDRDGGGIGISSAYIMINGRQIVLRDETIDLLGANGSFSVATTIFAERGAIYDVELYATDTAASGPNFGLVDSTIIRVPENMGKGNAGRNGKGKGNGRVK